MKFEIENPTAMHLMLSAVLLQRAKEEEWDLEFSEIGHNQNSDWVYIYSEFEAYSMGVCCYNSSEGVQYVWTDHEDGTEIIETSLQELENEIAEQYGTDMYGEAIKSEEAK